MVQRVEKFAAELQLPCLPQRKILERRQVRVRRGRAADQAPPGIAVHSARHVARLNKGIQIEELRDESVAIRMADGDVRCLDAGRELSALRTSGTIERDVASHQESERNAAL